MGSAIALLAADIDGPPAELMLVFAAWFFILGSILGSFVNVVIHRLPRGMSVSQPPSHCPRCKHAIRWFDNVPVLSWLVLRGRCRDCGAPISARYPAVEAACGAILVLVLLCDGGTWWAVALVAGRVDGDFLAVSVRMAADAALLLTVLAAMLIRYDGRCVPGRLWWTAALAIVAATLLSLAGDHPGTRGGWMRGWVAPSPLWAALGGVIGLALGSGAARFARDAKAITPPKNQKRNDTAGTAQHGPPAAVKPVASRPWAELIYGAGCAGCAFGAGAALVAAAGWLVIWLPVLSALRNRHAENEKGAIAAFPMTYLLLVALLALVVRGGF